MIDALKRQAPSQPAVIDAGDGNVTTYGQLMARVEAIVGCLLMQPGRPLVFLCSANAVDSIAIYLACLAIRFPVCLLDADPSHLRRLVETYSPQLIYLPSGSPPPPGYRLSKNWLEGTYRLYLSSTDHAPAGPSHPDLALLLSTSGSTGNPKMVRLTRENLMANACSIVQYLGISEKERSIQGLPFNYSYGLSLVNTHLLAGGTLVISRHSFMRPEFWRDFAEHRCTSFAGVPYMYETLHRLRFDPSQHSTLRTMTQAGGALRPELVEAFHQKAGRARCRFFVMYGQTEATARVSYVPPERLGEKIGSIGIPIPGGKMELGDVEGLKNVRELVYRGPNVMMGYAETAACLARGDDTHQILHTGDLARMDDEGFFYLTGRLNRIAKLFGRRINLADVESDIEANYPVHAAAVDTAEHLTVFIEMVKTIDPSAIGFHISRYLNVTPMAITVKLVDSLPLTSSGKKDYKVLAS